MKLRIIAGKHKGYQLDAPHGHRTHPMGEKIRGALFNMLGDISGLKILDCFAGSGALSLEAFSRGAAGIVAVDNDKSAQLTIQDNIDRLNANKKVKLVKANVGSWVKRDNSGLFDVVIIDPPYDKVNYATLIRLAYATKNQGIVIYSLPNKHEFSLPEHDFKKLSEKSYAAAALVFYRRVG